MVKNEMKLNKFLLGVLLLFTAAIVSKYFSYQDLIHQNHGLVLYALLGEAVGVVAGGVFLGLLVWLVIRLIRGANKSPDPRRFSLYAAVLVFAWSIVLGLINGP